MRLFADLPHAIANSAELSNRLTYTMGDLGYEFPEYPTKSGRSMMSLLRELTEKGARERYRPLHEKAKQQIERELRMIEKLGLAGYFLIVWDIVRFCKENDILAQGRGSAANSAVCYSLGITAVDPVAMELLFERFFPKNAANGRISILTCRAGEARTCDPVRIRTLRTARRRDDRKRHHVPGQVGRTRHRKGARVRR